MSSKSKTRSLSPAAAVRKKETENRYRALLERRTRSGETLRAFAATVGIPAATLAWWTYELRRREALRAATPDVVRVPTFLPVTLKGDEPRGAPSRAMCEIVLGGGRLLPRVVNVERKARPLESFGLRRALAPRHLDETPVAHELVDQLRDLHGHLRPMVYLAGPTSGGGSNGEENGRSSLAVPLWPRWGPPRTYP